MKKQTTCSYRYIAGLFDGEGSLGVYGKKSKQAMMRISNTDKEALQIVQQFLDKKISSSIYESTQNLNDKRTIKGKKPCWSLGINVRKEQQYFLEKIIPFLLIKRKQAIMVLDWIKSQPFMQRQNPEERRKQGNLLKCPKCRKLLPKEEFWKNKHDKRYGREDYCKNCARQYEKDRYWSGKDKSRRQKNYA